MSQKVYLALSGTIFGVIAVLQLTRAIYGWHAQVATFEVPVWLSWVAAVVAGYLAISAFILLRK
jgi:hypothetical protein